MARDIRPLSDETRHPPLAHTPSRTHPSRTPLLPSLPRPCSGGPLIFSRRLPLRSAREKPKPLRYVAIGASETWGVGAGDQLREAWPQVFYREGLPRHTAFVNLAVPGTTVDEALTQQLPYARELRPDLVTVWLNVNDIIARVRPPRIRGGTL